MTTAPPRSTSGAGSHAARVPVNPATTHVSVMPDQWRAAASGALPGLAREIGEHIRREIAEYAADSSGAMSGEIARFVEPALQMFMQSLVDGRPLTEEQAGLFRQLGRIEAEAGRSHDILQAAYRIASQAVMHQLLDWERRFRTPRQTVAQISAAVFSFIDELARLSAEGFDAATADRSNATRKRSRLIGQLIDGASHDELISSAARLGWSLPDRCLVVEVLASRHLGDLELVELAAAAFGDRAVAGMNGRRHLIVTGQRVDLDVARAAVAGRDICLVVGPRVPLADAGSSAQLAHRCTSLRDIETAGSGVFVCTDHLLDLAAWSAADVLRTLAVLRLEPLMVLRPVKRLKYARLLSAWLECGSIHGSAPGILDKPRQTLRYQTEQLERMFGPALHDRTSRLEVMLALRSVLPAWEREVAGATSSDA